LSDRNLEDLVLRSPPEEAVIFEYGRFIVVDVKKLEQAWSKAPPSPPHSR
jgi:hypothetical protein